MLTFEDLNLTNRCALLDSLPKDFQIGVEIGVEAGIYSRLILQKTNMFLYCIDIWTSNSWYRERDLSMEERFSNTNVSPDLLLTPRSIFDNYLILAQQNLQTYNKRCILWQEDSIIAAPMFGDETFDFVYIDANHFYEEIQKDIIAWYPKVKISGIFAGHDYHDAYCPGVVQAVNEFATKYNKQFKIIPSHQGCPDHHPTDNRIKSPSWIFIKDSIC